MHQVNTTTDFEWNLLFVTKPKKYIKETTQQFHVEASLLAQKWQDKVERFQGVKHRALGMVPKLGPSFEEINEERAQTEEPKEEEKMDNGKQQMLLEDVKEPRV